MNLRCARSEILLNGRIVTSLDVWGALDAPEAAGSNANPMFGEEQLFDTYYGAQDTTVFIYSSAPVKTVVNLLSGKIKAISISACSSITADDYCALVELIDRSLCDDVMILLYDANGNIVVKLNRNSDIFVCWEHILEIRDCP